MGLNGDEVVELPVSGLTVWLTGLSGSGKSTLASELVTLLRERDRSAYRLDGDVLRDGLNADLGFDRTSRDENVRRVGEVARLLADAGLVCVVALISPYRAARRRARAIHEQAGLGFVEVYVDTPIEVCEQRDVRGLYARARAGELTHFTGVTDPYEAPTEPDLVIRSERTAPRDLAAQVADHVLARLEGRTPAASAP